MCVLLSAVEWKGIRKTSVILYLNCFQQVLNHPTTCLCDRSGKWMWMSKSMFMGNQQTFPKPILFCCSAFPTSVYPLGPDFWRKIVKTTPCFQEQRMDGQNQGASKDCCKIKCGDSHFCVFVPIMITPSLLSVKEQRGKTRGLWCLRKPPRRLEQNIVTRQLAARNSGEINFVWRR